MYREPRNEYLQRKLARGWMYSAQGETAIRKQRTFMSARDTMSIVASIEQEAATTDAQTACKKLQLERV